MNYITLKDSKRFSLLSGDKNKIHINDNFAKNFFFKKTIVHGINLLLHALIKYIDNSKDINITNIKTDFKNYCLNNERFSIVLKKNIIYVKNKLNDKILVQIQHSNLKSFNLKFKNKKTLNKIINFYNSKKITILNNLDLIKHLLFISRYIGNIKPASGALIHSISTSKINYNDNSKRIIKTKKIINSIYSIKLLNYGFSSTILSGKLTPLIFNKQKYDISKNIINKIKNKKLLFFGISGDISKSIILTVRKAKPKILSYSFKKNSISIKEMRKLEKFLKVNKPHYIFYLSSPPIMNDTQNNTTLYNVYNDVYTSKFKIILNLLQKNSIKSKIFYPSSIFLNNKKKYLRLKSYLRAKDNAEKICKSHPYSKFIKCFRLPQFKTGSNYNILGFYNGIETHKIRKYLVKFF